MPSAAQDDEVAALRFGEGLSLDDNRICITVNGVHKHFISTQWLEGPEARGNESALAKMVLGTKEGFRGTTNIVIENRNMARQFHLLVGWLGKGNIYLQQKLKRVSAQPLIQLASFFCLEQLEKAVEAEHERRKVEAKKEELSWQESAKWHKEMQQKEAMLYKWKLHYQKKRMQDEKDRHYNRLHHLKEMKRRERERHLQALSCPEVSRQSEHESYQIELEYFKQMKQQEEVLYQSNLQELKEEKQRELEDHKDKVQEYQALQKKGQERHRRKMLYYQS